MMTAKLCALIMQISNAMRDHARRPNLFSLYGPANAQYETIAPRVTKLIITELLLLLFAINYGQQGKSDNVFFFTYQVL